MISLEGRKPISRILARTPLFWATRVASIIILPVSLQSVLPICRQRTVLAPREISLEYFTVLRLEESILWRNALRFTRWGILPSPPSDWLPVRRFALQPLRDPALVQPHTRSIPRVAYSIVPALARIFSSSLVLNRAISAQSINSS